MKSKMPNEGDELAIIEEMIVEQRGFLKDKLQGDLLDAALAPLLRRRAELQASCKSGQSPSVSVASRSRSVAIGGDMINSVAITGDFYTGPQSLNHEEAIRAYCAVLVSMWQHLPLRAIDVAASDPTGRPEYLDLAAIYIDLDIKTPKSTAKRPKKRSKRSRPGSIDLIETSPSRAMQAASANRRAVILGEPGSGKSTFLSYITLSLASARLEPKKPWLRRFMNWERAAGGLLPIHVVLRDFASTLPAEGPLDPSHLWSFIVERLRAQNLGAAVEPIHTALEDGWAIVLLDGLDEIPESARQARVRDAIAAFGTRYPESDMLVTCRTLSYEVPACRLPDIPSFELAPFTSVKIDEFIGAWYEELSRRGAVPRKESTELAQRLREAIRRPDLKEFASNPLLLTIMAVVHTHRGRLPESRALLYEETVDLLLWRWEDQRTRRFRRLLEDAGVKEIDLKQVLWALAFAAQEAGGSQQRGGVTDIPQWRIVDVLAELHPDGSLDWARKMVEVMKVRAGLLLERLPKVYTFPHRTFQEYLAGAHLSARGDFSGCAATLLRAGPSWREVVLLAVGRLVHLTGDTDRVLALLGELCPERPVSVEHAWLDVQMAGEVLEEVGLHRISVKQLGRDLAERIRWRLLEGVCEGPLDHMHRAYATLGRIGDPRFRRDAWYLPDDELLGFIEIPAGPFLMGTDPTASAQYYDDELPQHLMVLPGYYIARYPVTVEQFRAFVKESGRIPTDPDCLKGHPSAPVTQVRWEDAWIYAEWLTKKLGAWGGTPSELARLLRTSGRGKRWRVVLPSEAEWEKAARGTDGITYPWGNQVRPYRERNTLAYLVGSFAQDASPYGCRHMIDGVHEWTRNVGQGVDAIFGYPYRASDGREVRRAAHMHRVARGGPRARCAVRFHVTEGGHHDVGFRIAISSYA